MTLRNLRASIVRDQEWDSALSNLHSLDLAHFVFCLSLFNAMHGEATLDIVDETEVLASLVDRYHIHEAGWVCIVCSDLLVDLDESLHHD